MEYEDYEIRLLDAFKEARYAYWSAFLTINGIMLSILTVAIISKTITSPIAYYIIFSSIFSIAMIIYNHRSVARHYRELSLQTAEQIARLSADEKNEEENRSVSQGKWQNRREATCELLFISEMIAIIVLLFY